MPIMAEHENPLVREAKTCFRLGDLDKAESLFKQAVAKAPQDAAALVGLARSRYLRGDKKKAQDLLASAEKIDPKRVETLCTRAVFAEKDGDGKTAAELFARAAKSAPNDFEARFNHARMIAKEKRWAEAVKEYEAAAALDPKNATALLQLGATLIQAGNLQAGLDRMAQAIEANPKFLEGYLVLSDILIEGKKDDAAEKVLALARTSIPGHREILERAAGLHQRRLDLAKARDAVREIAKIAPKDAVILKRLGLLELATGSPLNAEAALKKAAELAPKDADMPFTLGIVYEAMKLYDPAKAAYRKALEVDPKHWGAMTNLGRLLATDPKPAFDEALKLQEKARQIAPKESAPLLNLALALEAKGERAKAAEAAKAVLALPAAPHEHKEQATRVVERAAKK